MLTVSETGKNEIVSLTDIGKKYAATKIPEFRIVNDLKEGKNLQSKTSSKGAIWSQQR